MNCYLGYMHGWVICMGVQIRFCWVSTRYQFQPVGHRLKLFFWLGDNISNVSESACLSFDHPMSNHEISVPVVESVLWGITMLLTVFLVLSVIGNIISILAIMFGDRMQNKANCFIFSLALSDLCSGLVSPIGIYIRTWGFNPFLWPAAFCNVSRNFKFIPQRKTGTKPV